MRCFTLNSTRIALIAIVLLVSGCSLLRESWSGPQQRMSGLLEQGNAGFSLRQCGADGAQPVLDSAELKAIFAQAAQPGQTAIFVDLLGRTDSAGRIQPSKVLRMQSQGRGCADTSANSAQWVALQYHPAWRAALAVNGLTRSDAAQGYSPVSVVTEQLPDGSLNARSLSGDLELWLYPQDCQDVATGDYFHMRSVLLVDGVRYSGCGYQGRQTAP
ncbi:MAG: hypothetical protein V7756_17095 [Halopseudomonas sp.]|uniref:hypothetical protein n=1 Tax=Halopseudomonas sp. TaxID=2901191 RepID=UPI0030026978